VKKMNGSMKRDLQEVARSGGSAGGGMFWGVIAGAGVLMAVIRWWEFVLMGIGGILAVVLLWWVLARSGWFDWGGSSRQGPPAPPSRARPRRHRTAMRASGYDLRAHAVLTYPELQPSRPWQV
jgi:hypothetical protein